MISDVLLALRTLMKSMRQRLDAPRRKEIEMANLKKHMDLLGMRVEDRVTEFVQRRDLIWRRGWKVHYNGVVTSVSFDLYGCIQTVVHPGAGADGKLREQHWFDVNRLRVIAEEPVMARPEFEWTPQVIAEAGKGPAERPAYCKA